jgi:hypothetical protein
LLVVVVGWCHYLSDTVGGMLTYVYCIIILRVFAGEGMNNIIGKYIINLWNEKGYPPIVNMSHGQIVLFTKIGYLHKYYNDN